MDIKREIELILKATDRSMGTGLKAAKGQVSGVESAVGSLKKALGAVGAALGARELISTFQKTVDAAGRLQDLANRFNVSASSLSAMGVASRDAGIEIDSLAQAMRFMLVNISAGAKIIDDLHLNLAELKAMRPEDAFVKILEAVKAIANQGDRMRAAGEIFGTRTGSQVLQLGDNFGYLVTQAKQLGLAFDDKTIANLDATGDALDRLKSRVEVLKASIAEKIHLEQGIDAWIAALAPKQYRDEARRAYNTKYGFYRVGADRDFSMTGARGYESASPGMGYTGQGAPLFPGMSRPMTFSSDAGDEAKKWDGSAWWAGVETPEQITARIKAAQDAAREDADWRKQFAEDREQEALDAEDAAIRLLEIQRDNNEEAVRFRDYLVQARIEGVEGMIGGALQLGSALGGGAQRWYAALQKVQSVMQAILAIQRAIALLQFVSLGANTKNPGNRMGLPSGPMSPIGTGLALSPGGAGAMAVLNPGGAGAISPFSLPGGDGGAAMTVINQIARPIGRLDGLDMGAAAYAAAREYERRVLS